MRRQSRFLSAVETRKALASRLSATHFSRRPRSTEGSAASFPPLQNENMQRILCPCLKRRSRRPSLYAKTRRRYPRGPAQKSPRFWPASQDLARRFSTSRSEEHTSELQS